MGTIIGEEPFNNLRTVLLMRNATNLIEQLYRGKHVLSYEVCHGICFIWRQTLSENGYSEPKNISQAIKKAPSINQLIKVLVYKAILLVLLELKRKTLFLFLIHFQL